MHNFYRDVSIYKSTLLLELKIYDFVVIIIFMHYPKGKELSMILDLPNAVRIRQERGSQIGGSCIKHAINKKMFIPGEIGFYESPRLSNTCDAQLCYALS